MKSKRIQPLSATNINSPPNLIFYTLRSLRYRGLKRFNRETLLKLSLLPHLVVLPTCNRPVCQNAWMVPITANPQKISKSRKARLGILTKANEV